MPTPRDFYDSEYHFAGDVARPDERRIVRALRRLEPLAGLTYLDLGCGSGWAAKVARERFQTGRTIGIDFSRTALKLARGHTPEILWIAADGTMLPIADQSIDSLYCDGALEHFPDVSKGLSEIARVLRPGGRCVLVVPNFYVKTEQPMEFRATWWNWKRRIESTGLRVRSTGVDWGPRLTGTVGFSRMIKRLVGKTLGLVPFMQYQFVFTVQR